jgi:hypothetical protein
MKRKILALAAGMGAATILAPAASAQLYGGVGYTVFQADVGSEDASLGTIMGRLGYKTSPILAFEGEASIGVQDESFDVLGTTVDVGIENQYGVFAVGMLPVPGVGDLFVRGGYASITVDASAGGLGSASEDGSGLAYGAGVMLNFIPFTKLRLDYTRYEADDGEFDSLGLSGLFTF